MMEFAHTQEQRRLALEPGQDVMFLRGRIMEAQLRSHRPSYVNAVLIHRAGRDVRFPCGNCAAKAARSPYRVPHPFPTCRKISGYFGSCCSNCKWPDGAASCSVRDDVEFGAQLGHHRPGQQALPSSRRRLPPPPPQRRLPPPPLPRLLPPPPSGPPSPWAEDIADFAPPPYEPGPPAATPPRVGNSGSPIVVKDEDDDNDDNGAQGGGGSQEDPILLD
jgi:hypothetical protein